MPNISHFHTGRTSCQILAKQKQPTTHGRTAVLSFVQTTRPGHLAVLGFVQAASIPDALANMHSGRVRCAG